MSNRRFAQESRPEASPPPPRPAIMHIQCPYCLTPLVVLTGARLVSPEPLAEGVEPTPEQAQQQAMGHQVVMAHQCQQGHQWHAVCVQKPGQPAVLLLSDMDGTLLDAGILELGRQRQAAMAKLFVPGRMN